MSFHRKSDFAVIDDEDNDFGPHATIDLDNYPDENNRLSVDENASAGSTDSAQSKKYGRSASISVATGPLSTGLSFILDMDKEEATEHSHSLHDDIEKMFDKSPTITFDQLISGGGESRPSERGFEITETPLPANKYIDEYDITSHRRSSFPHIHVPLKSIPNHSLKTFSSLVDKDKDDALLSEAPTKKRKKKKTKVKLPKKSKSNIFPSKSAMLSPVIPEVENEDYGGSEESSYDDDNDDEYSKLLDETDSVDPFKSISSSKSDPVTLQEERPPVLSPTLSQTSDISYKAGGLFYIGGSDLQGHHKNNLDVPSSAVSESSSVQTIPVVSDSAPVVVILESEDNQPLISTSIKEASRNEPFIGLDDNVPLVDKNKVTFLLGEGDNEDTEEVLSGEDEEEQEGPVWMQNSQEKSRSRTSPPISPKNSRSEKHKHRRHHQEHYNMEDLMSRRQRGSDVQLHVSDSLKRVPTETEEAMMLQSVDLDEMASHRMENLQGMRKHKIGRKKHKTVSSVVYIGKADKSRRKFIKPSKKLYDHSPHEVFVELDELYTGENYEVEWREKARWIKFEEDVEEGADRWGKPHVASLSFHSLIELRKGLENGSLILDLEATDLIQIVQRTVENMVIHDQIPSEVKGQVMRTLLTKHKWARSGSYVSRHQREQLSLMKTLSSASFANIGSSANLAGMDSATNHMASNQQTNGYTSHRSMSVPATQHEALQFTSPLLETFRPKKEKKAKKKESGRVEFVKVDVDNNHSLQDGVHIGLVPQEADRKDSRPDNKTSLMRRIPRDAEACTVLVGCVDYLIKPAMAFVRLAERHVLDNLTEVPLPVRFVFILLGPEDGVMDYHEIGRSISTLMSNQHFHEVVYRAESRSEILHAINEFLNESIVLPPGDWDQKTLLPVMDMARKRAKIRRKKLKKKEELEALLKKEEIEKIPMDPLKRTGRLFGGLINDVKRRYPHYASDFTDALSIQCVMALIFIFFACLAPCIAFGGLLGEKTYGKIGVTETIISTALTNLMFGLFSAQPLVLYGATGPVLVFEKHLYGFCKTSHIDFLTWRVWIGLWVFIITVFVIALEGSFIVRYITRFTEEVFAILISLIFIFEVIHKLEEIYEEHPLRDKQFYCDNFTKHKDGGNHTMTFVPKNDSSNGSTNTEATVMTSLYNLSVILNNSAFTSVSPDGTEGHYHGKRKYAEMEQHNEPNTALLSTILIMGTFLIAYFLRIFRNSKFLGRSARRALGDFGIFTAIVLMVLFDYIFADTYTQKLDIPLHFGHTDRTKRRWIINPIGDDEHRVEIWLMFMAIIPAFLIFLLLFLECQLTEMLLHKKEFKLKKGSGFHLDQFILGVMTFVCALFGLPWMCAATVRSVAHVSALSVMSRTHAPGEKPKLLEVKDQRVTNIVMNLLIGTSLLWGPVLRAVPMAVLFGVFLYLGVSAISGVQLYKRIKLLFMPVKHHPGKSYVRRVRTFKMHMFTIIQIILVVILWIVKSTIAAIAFPLLVFMMVPFRLKLMPKIFTHEELEVLDKEEEDSDDEEDEDPDFYQLAHMPI